MPKVSVIVPVYNTEKYLPRCIDSILAQTFTDFELILVNDGSTDNSGKICDEYAKKDSRIVVIHKENGGASSARNAGIDAAQSEWISFVDSDDEILTKYLDELFNIEYDLNISGIRIITGAKVVDNIPQNILISTNDFEYFINKSYQDSYLNGPTSKLFKLNLIRNKNIKFNEYLTSGEDTNFILSYLLHAKSVRVVATISYIAYQEANLHHKYMLNATQTNTHLYFQDCVITSLEEKYSIKLGYVRNALYNWYYASFLAYLKVCTKFEYYNNIKLYKKYNLMRFRPSFNYKEYIYFILLTHFPLVIRKKIQKRNNDKNSYNIYR